MTEIKLCKDCVWYTKDWVQHLTGGGDIYDKCMNPILNNNFVTGKNKGKFCDTARDYDTLCGKNAKYFESRK